MNKEYIINSFGTILEMLTDRGIDIGNVTKQHVQDILETEYLNPVIEVVINKIKVIYYTPQKLKGVEIRKNFEDEVPYDLYILVLQENITQNNLKMINGLNINVEIHLITKLQFNITKHELVPKHELIRDKAKIDEILETYKLKNKYQLPIILKSDPVARYYGMKNGDVVQITRTSPTAGVYVMYRCCL
jgi:DNA-directed RNA polymerase I, II, and III subunit RPABC1